MKRKKKYTNPEMRAICRTVRIFNSCEFSDGHVFIDYMPGDNGRMAHLPYWSVSKAGEKLSDKWYDHGALNFHVMSRVDKNTIMSVAMDWACKRFGVKSWAKEPFGSYMDEKFVEERKVEIIEAYLVKIKEESEDDNG